jgi:hypothetical protein
MACIGEGDSMYDVLLVLLRYCGLYWHWHWHWHWHWQQWQ